MVSSHSKRQRPDRGRRLAAGALGIASLFTSVAVRAESPPDPPKPPVAPGPSAAPSPAPVAPPVAPGPSAAPSPAPVKTAAPVEPSAADAPMPGVVERAHHAYAERPSAYAFNPRTMGVRWNDSWPKVGVPEMVTIGAAGILTFAARAIPVQKENWRGVTGFDAGARDALRLGSAGARSTAADASDLLLTLLLNQLVVDATLVAWWGHDRPSVATQLVLIDLEALALTGGIHALVSTLASRWRPYRATCVGPVETQTQDCQSSKQYYSFWSGHSSGAFTAAGLMCMHHAYLPLYGGGAAEPLTCAASVAAAATVAYLRVAADQHFLTDVLVGAAVGTISGLGVPWVLHYRHGPPTRFPSSSKAANQVDIRVAPGPLGVSVLGEF